MDMTLCNIIYSAAANAGFLQECLWLGQSTMVGLQTNDHAVLNRLTQSSDTSMTYPSSCMKRLKTGDRVTIGLCRYQVRDVMAIADGSEMRATLTLL